MKVVLELQEQLANVRRVTVRHDIVIGRGSDCNLRLSAPQMSRRHCFLRVGRDGVSVTDLDSSNGTYVDNKRIKPGERVELVTGSILTLGPVNFIVHLKEDSGSPSKTEGERSRSRSKPPKPSSDSSTIVSSAAAIVAEESKGKAPSKDASERTAASAADREKTARTKGEPADEALAKHKKTSRDDVKTRAEVPNVPVDTAKKAVAAAAVAATAAPLAEQVAKAESKPEPVGPSPVAEKIDADNVESPAAESSWLTDDSPDDLSFFGGQTNDVAAPLDEAAGSEVVEVVDDVVAVDDVVEEVVEVLDDNDIFAEEVVEAVLVDEPVDAVEAVEVLDEVPMDVVEVLEDETPANAITADLDESDLFGEQFVEVLEEPEVLAEVAVVADVAEEIDEAADVVEVLEDEAEVEVLEAGLVEPDANDAELVEVLEESNDFFDQLGIVEEMPQQSPQQVAVVDAAPPVEDSVVEVADSEWFDEPAEVVDVVEEVAPIEAAEVVFAEPDLDDAELLDAHEEPSDFFASLGIDAEPQQAIAEAAAIDTIETIDEAEVFADVGVEAEPVEESGETAEVLEKESAVEFLEEPSDFFSSLGIDVEPRPAIEDAAVIEAVDTVDASEAFADVSVESVPAEESVAAVEVLEEESAVELLEEPSDFFSSLGIDVEPQPAIDDAAVIEAVDTVDASEAFADVSVDSEPAEESAAAVEVLEEEASVDVLEEPSDFFDSLGIDVEPQQAIDEVVAAQPVAAVDESPETDWFADAVEEVVDVAEAQPATAIADDVEMLDDAQVLDDIEVEESSAAAEHADAIEEFDAEVEEVAWFEEAAEEDVATAEEDVIEEAVPEEEVVEVAEEDEGSNWFSVGDDKGDDDDDRALREFLKGF